MQKQNVHPPEKRDQPTDKSRRLRNDSDKNNKISWSAFEDFYWQKTKTWFTVSISIAIILLLIAIFSKDPLMIITFVLAIVMFFIVAVREPKKIQISFDDRGIQIKGKIYPYHEFESFWIIYNPPINYISLKNHKKFSRPIKLLLESQNPVIIRQYLKEHLPEVEQKESFIEILERILRI